MGNNDPKCKDCLEERGFCHRPSTYPGPRCYTHHKKVSKARKERSHDLHVRRRFGLSDGEFRQLWEYQGKRCPLCGRTPQKTPQVDHDHACCEGRESCGQCVRGATCSSCNRYLARIQDDPEAGLRIFQYLTRPPYQEMKGWV